MKWQLWRCETYYIKKNFYDKYSALLILNICRPFFSQSISWRISHRQKLSSHFYPWPCSASHPRYVHLLSVPSLSPFSAYSLIFLVFVLSEVSMSKPALLCCSSGSNSSSFSNCDLRIFVDSFSICLQIFLFQGITVDCSKHSVNVLLR